MRAPLVLFCNNNQWAISTPLEAQTAAETLADKAIGYGIPGVRVDGADVLAVFEATRDVVARAREGGGPDRKSTRLNSSHSQISYAVFCLKKKKKKKALCTAADTELNSA